MERRFLTETDKASINNLLNGLGCQSSYYTDVTPLFIKLLERSKQVSGLGGHQAKVDTWLLEVLRNIYYKHPEIFSSSDLQSLRSISHLPDGEGRIPITPLSWPITSGLFVIKPKGVFVLYDKPGHILQLNGKDLNIYNVTFHRGVYSFYSEINTEISAKELALFLINKHYPDDDECYKERVLRDNFSNFRQEHNLPDAQLRKTNRKRTRVTHCYLCKGHLESGIYFECSICGWLVCSCGACGCGFTREEYEHSNAEYDVVSGAGDYEDDGEQGLLLKELSDENRLYAQSKSEGWFYDDDNNKRNDY